MTKPKIVAKPAKSPPPTQREIDQSTTIDTMRVLMAAIIRKHGTLDTIYLTRAEIESVKDGDLRIVDDAKGIHLAIRVGKASPLLRPRLLTH